MWTFSFAQGSKSVFESLVHTTDSSLNTGRLDKGFGIGNSVEFETGRIADGRFGYALLFLLIWLYYSILVRQK